MLNGLIHNRPTAAYCALAASVLLGPPAYGAGSDEMPNVLQIRPQVYVLTARDTNTVVETGSDGTLVVDPGPMAAAAATLKAIHAIAQSPIRYIVNTSLDSSLIASDEVISQAGYSFAAGQLGRAAPVMARQEVLSALINRPGEHLSAWALPSEVYTRPQWNFFLNGEGIELIWEPSAHSNGDTVVRLPQSDVVVTGDIFDDTRFPRIDLSHGGSIQGEFDALNELLNREVITPIPLVGSAVLQGHTGTLVVPVRGPVCDQADLVTYRDMVGTVILRVQNLINHHATLQQVLAAKPTQGYDRRWGADSGDWTTNDFVEAVYRSLSMPHKLQRTEDGP